MMDGTYKQEVAFYNASIVDLMQTNSTRLMCGSSDSGLRSLENGICRYGNPTTFSGVGNAVSGGLVNPNPRAALLLRPQHLTSPASVITHV